MLQESCKERKKCTDNHLTWCWFRGFGHFACIYPLAVTSRGIIFTKFCFHTSTFRCKQLKFRNRAEKIIIISPKLSAKLFIYRIWYCAIRFFASQLFESNDLINKTVERMCAVIYLTNKCERNVYEIDLQWPMMTMMCIVLREVKYANRIISVLF